jgi:glycosyltransferase involved in cell wall biosynthesis
MRHLDREHVQPHVAVTTTHFPTPDDGAEAQVRAIPDLQVRPTWFGPSVFGIHGLERVRRLRTLPLVPLSLLSLATYVRRQRIEIIHATEKPRDAFYAALLGKMTGAKTVIQVHVKYERWINPSVKWALGQADAVVGVSDYVANTIVAAGYPADRVFGVLNSLDLVGSSWDPALDGRPARRALGIAEHAPLVGIFSRLFSWKGHDALLDALAVVKREIPDVRLLVVGDDDPRAHPGGGSYRTELEARVSALGLEDNVIFTGYRSDVPELMAAVDVYAMPSWEEPFGMVYLEAMAMRKPVVAWASGGAPEVVKHGETGFVVEPRSIGVLSDAILRLLRDPALRRRFGEAGRQRVEQSFAPQRMCQDILEVYRAVLGVTVRSRLVESTAA